MYYKRITRTLHDKGFLVPENQNTYEVIENDGMDWYESAFLFNEDAYQAFKESGTIKGITDVLANKIWFDFDDEFNPDAAKTDAIGLVHRLVGMDINPNDLYVTFSGNKGIGVEVKLDQYLNPRQIKDVAFALAEDFKTFDVKVYNATRVLRIAGTPHNKTKLFKTPLKADQLYDTMDEIMNLAKSQAEPLDVQPNPVKADLFLKIIKDKPQKPVKETPTIELKGLDFSNKPKFLSNCRWALQNGFFQEGNRNSAFLCLAATYKNLGFELEHVYRLLKGVAEIQAARNTCDRFADEELYNNVVMEVFSVGWKNGQYSCKDSHDNFLHAYCKSMGPNACKQDNDKAIVELTSLSTSFQKYTNELEKNRMTTGIHLLDENVLISTSMLVGLLAAPSAGKSQTTFQVLNNCSKNGISNMFFSMDMGLPLVYTRLVQKHFRIPREEVFSIYRNEPQPPTSKWPIANEIDEALKKEYSKTKFCFKGALSCEDIREAIIAQQEKTGEKVRFVAVDYLECISGPYSDATANTAIVAQKLKDIANELETCIWLLLQTQKSSGDPSDKLLSMRNVKGASVIEQACSVIISLSRPGFAPRTTDSKSEDNYITISTVKDRMGQLVTDDCYWDGLTGDIRPLTGDERGELAQIRERKKNEKATEAGKTDWI